MLLADALAAAGLYLTAAVLAVIAAAMLSIGQRIHKQHPASAVVLLAGAALLAVLFLVAVFEGMRA